jgi:hypothetical protein
VDRDPEERREEPRWSDRSPSEGSPSEAANEGPEGDRRRGQQVPPALETSEAKEPSESEAREEPFPHGEERPQDGLERPWWRRIFRGPHEEATERRWWEFWR